MYKNPYASSLETKILSSTPMELVNLLYEAAIEAVQAARQHLSRGEISKRAHSVSRAVEMLAELSGSLNHKQGGEISLRLAALYDYSQRSLLDANFRQSDDGLAEVETLLRTLSEAWSAIEAPRSNGFTDSHVASYSFGANPATTDDYRPSVANQWCA
jgi:flagellar protein FliS